MGSSTSSDASFPLSWKVDVRELSRLEMPIQAAVRNMRYRGLDQEGERLGLERWNHGMRKGIDISWGSLGSWKGKGFLFILFWVCLCGQELEEKADFSGWTCGVGHSRSKHQDGNCGVLYERMARALVLCSSAGGTAEEQQASAQRRQTAAWRRHWCC